MSINNANKYMWKDLDRYLILGNNIPFYNAHSEEAFKTIPCEIDCIDAIINNTNNFYEYRAS